MNQDDRSASWPLLSLDTYERLAGQGIAAADIQGGAVDHVTARRLAIWLAVKSEQPRLVHGLVRFTETGAISPELMQHLGIHVRSTMYPHQPQASRLLQYCAARAPDMGPIGENFAAACDQIDRTEIILADLREKAKQASGLQQRWPENDGPPVVALAGRDSRNRTVTFVLDDTTANIAIFAVTAHAIEREAHLREVEQSGQKMPEGSYGRNNREAIAAREARVATRLRALERAYRTAIDRDTATAHAPAIPLRRAQHAADREIELE